MQDVVTALVLTVVGMGLVLASLVVFWALMLVLVRFTSPDRPGSAATDQLGSIAEQGDVGDQSKLEAAVAAVVVALAQQSVEKPRTFPVPPSALVSAWQSARRSEQLGQRGPGR